MNGRIFDAADLNKVLKAIKGYEQVLNKVKILTAEKGKIIAQLKIEEEHSNIMGGLHGGLSATLVDSISSLALTTLKNGTAPSVSVNMNIDYIKGAKIGDEVEILADTVKIGKTLAFLEVFIKDKKSGALLVKGSHTKFLMPNQKKFYAMDK